MFESHRVHLFIPNKKARRWYAPWRKGPYTHTLTYNRLQYALEAPSISGIFRRWRWINKDKPQTAWDNPDSDPIQDIKDAMQQVLDNGLGPSHTIHHPKCKIFKTGKIVDCNCGGSAFPT